jgi:hypothetical protein
VVSFLAAATKSSQFSGPVSGSSPAFSNAGLFQNIVCTLENFGRPYTLSCQLTASSAGLIKSPGTAAASSSCSQPAWPNSADQPAQVITTSTLLSCAANRVA